MSSPLPASIRAENGTIMARWHEGLKGLSDFDAVLRVAAHELEIAHGIFLGPTAVTWEHPLLTAGSDSDRYFTEDVLGTVIRLWGDGHGQLLTRSTSRQEAGRVGEFGPNSWAFIPPQTEYFYRAQTGPVRCQGIRVRIA